MKMILNAYETQRYHSTANDMLPFFTGDVMHVVSAETLSFVKIKWEEAIEKRPKKALLYQASHHFQGPRECTRHPRLAEHTTGV